MAVYFNTDIVYQSSSFVKCDYIVYLMKMCWIKVKPFIISIPEVIARKHPFSGA